jgi:hypothetical protein
MLGSVSIGQIEKLDRVQQCMQAKDIVCAKQAVDSAFLDPKTRQAYAGWYYRAFVYYELSKKDKYNIISSNRDTSIYSAIRSNNSKPAPEQAWKDGNNNVIKKHSETYYNMCIKYLYDSLKYEKSSAAYLKYKTLYALIDSSFNFKAKDIEYYSAVGSHYADLFNANTSKTEYSEVGKVALMKVLDLDPKNISASVNLGIIYYNQGVNLINSMDLDTPLDKLEIIQDNSAKLFKQSLPFMNRVYELDPKNVKALESLSRIYHALNDTQKAEEFNSKLEKAKQGN